MEVENEIESCEKYELPYLKIEKLPKEGCFTVQT